MVYKVYLVYFRPTGKYLTRVETAYDHAVIAKIWAEIHELRRLGRLPGLRPNAGRDLFIVVDVPDHPQNVPHLVMPPFIDDDDVTPPRVSTDEMVPLVRVPLEEMSRTSTRDIVRIDKIDVDADTEVQRRSHTPDDEITPVEIPIPKPKPPLDEK
jgi:hypothetical protein